MPRKKRESVKRDRNPEALGIAGFTLGVVSLVMLLFSPALGIVMAIVGFFFCLFQMKKLKTRAAKTGIILTIVSFVANIAWWVIYALVVYPYVQQGLSVLGSAP